MLLAHKKVRLTRNHEISTTMPPSCLTQFEFLASFPRNLWSNSKFNLWSPEGTLVEYRETKNIKWVIFYAKSRN